MARSRLLCLALLAQLLLAHEVAQAQCGANACVHAGTTLATVSISQSSMLDGMISSLTGANVDLSVADHQALATGNIRLDTLLGALQVQGVGGSATEAAAADISLNQLYRAAATALRSQGDTVNAAAFDTLAVQVASAPGTVSVGDLVTFDSRPQTLASTQLNLLDFVSGSASLLNTSSLAQVKNVTVAGSALGLTGFADTVALAVSVLEPAVFVCGSQGAQFHSAGIRIRAKVNLVDTTTPLNVLGIASLSLTLVSLDLVVQVARGTGTLQAINAVTNAVTVQATPGVAALYLGQISDAVLRKTAPINTTTELSPAEIAKLDLTLLTIPLSAAVTAKAWADGSALSPSTLNFTGPYPQKRTAATQGDFASTLVTTLLSNLAVTVDTGGLLGTLLGSLLNPLLSAVTELLSDVSNGVLKPVLDGVVSGLLNPLLTTLGVRLGEMDVTVDRVYFVPAGASCDDAAFCTVSDACNGSGSCIGAARVCSDGLSCTNDSCNETNDTCVATVQAASCVIAGQCLAAGAVDPANACRACNPAASTSAYSNRASGTSCDDGLFCTDGDACNALGSCLGGALKTCSDSKSCTIDVCNELADRCDNSISTGCLIDGSCVGQGALRPLFPCQICDGASNLLAWSNRPLGSSCDDGLFCSSGDQCTALGLCGGAANNCNDGIACTVDLCNELTDTCSSTFVGGCVIDGACRLSGSEDPSNPCHVCNPLASATSWSNKPAGTSCNDGLFCTVSDACSAAGICSATPRNCSDSLACTSDSCNESSDACVNTVSTGCVIGGSCVTSGAQNPASVCQLCDPLQLVTAWSNRANGTACNDGAFCTVSDQCTAGGCVGSARDCSDSAACTVDSCNETTDVCVNASSGCVINGSCFAAGVDEPGNGCRSCNPTVSASSWTAKGAGAPCDDGQFCTVGDACNGSGSCASTARSCTDGLTCTSDSCNETNDSCVNTVASGCAIAGACVVAGTLNPASVCQSCDPAQSSTAWSNRAAGTSCDDGQYCTTGDACTAGSCGGAARVCNDGVACTFDSCDEAADQCKFEAAGCVIDGVCRASNSNDPSNACRSCNPSVSSSAWTNKPAGTVCDDGQYCTVSDACNGQGLCATSARDCNDNQACTTDTCNESADACSNDVSTGCLIGGSCVAQAATNPAAPCQLCDASSARSAWSNRPAGTSCEDGLFCTQDDKCSAQGVCTAGTGAACASDGLTCTNELCNEASDSCTSTLGSGCLIDGSCVAEGSKNLANGCQLCRTSVSSSAWTTDYARCDSDGDGLYDAYERENDRDIDTDRDGQVDRLDADDDNDSLPTREEFSDANGNGRPDDARDLDDDLVYDYLDPDDDGDGRSTLKETEDALRFEEDTDEDEQLNWYDIDSDDDGLLDVTENENYPDAPPPARPFYLDASKPGVEHPDTDQDGLLDEVECPDSTMLCPDSDGDMRPDWNDPDDDGDGINTRFERPNGVDLDSDQDGRPNWLDRDDDNDSLETSDEEADLDGDHNPRDAQDYDGDGIPDYLDSDDDGDTLSTLRERNDAQTYGADVDGDQNPNWYDLDSDGDEIFDRDEPGDAAPHDGIPDYLQRMITVDAGVPDAGSEASSDAGIDASPASLPGDAATPGGEDGGDAELEMDADGEDLGDAESDADNAGDESDAQVAPAVDAASEPEAEDARGAGSDSGNRLVGGAAGGGLCRISDGTAASEVWSWLFSAGFASMAYRRRKPWPDASSERRSSARRAQR